jgi:glycosyltransferase involved in cell wall biosynthesis
MPCDPAAASAGTPRSKGFLLLFLQKKKTLPFLRNPLYPGTVTMHGQAMDLDGARLQALEAENARLAARMRQAEASAASQALRAQALHWQAAVQRGNVAMIRGSLFWRLTLPLRLAVVIARGVPKTSAEGQVLHTAWKVFRKDGLRTAIAQGLAWRKRQKKAVSVLAPPAAVVAPAGPPAGFSPLVLIIAELSVPQCAKYRVWQKQEHFARLGIPCRVVNWRDTADCFAAAATATQVILYRVPGSPDMLALIETLRGYGLPFAWEVDDLIFDEALYRQNSNLAGLDADLRRDLLEGVALYRRALQASGRGIASTPHLADAMRAACIADVAVVENALDQETLDLAARIRQSRVPHDSVVITYGSGTKTHDTDFRQAAPALLRILQTHPTARLRLIGDLNPPPSFDAVAAQIERILPVPYARYLALLGESDISLAPLEPTVFNDAKSNIKFLEAAILGLPSVCSPRAHFTAVMRDGENGFLAETENAWFAALDRLIADATLRARLGETARRDALARYAPDAIARDQVGTLFVPPSPRAPGNLRVLVANVFFAPRSYGGATIVVEEMVRRLHARADTEVFVATSLDPDAFQAMTRAVQDGVTIFRLPVIEGDVITDYDDPVAGEAFGAVLDAVRPDVVHLHAVQMLSGRLADACRARGVRYVITLHDPWWLCARQFMVRPDHTYCFQRRIDLRVCESCVQGARHIRQRAAQLRDALDGAALLISPSEAHRGLYLAQGIAPDRIVVAPNGVRLPDRPPARTPANHLRFGFVGGREPVKGSALVQDAFKALTRSDWELILVDHTLNLGFSSIDASHWRMGGTVRIVPAYAQDTMEDFFAGIDVLLFPSQWKESFGLTVREALARDVWVITTDGGGPADAVRDGVNGTIIPLDGQHAGLQRAVEALLDSPDRVRGFRNPYKQEIIGYEAQAVHLHGLLEQVADGK